MSKTVINIDISKLVFVAPRTSDINTGKCLIGDDDSDNDSINVNKQSPPKIQEPKISLKIKTAGVILSKTEDSQVKPQIESIKPEQLKLNKITIKTNVKTNTKIEPQTPTIVIKQEPHPITKTDKLPDSLLLYPGLNIDKFLLHKLVVELSPEWQKIIFSYKDFDGLCNRFQQELDNFPKTLKFILPYDHSLIFNAFKLTQFPPKVVILGQDPYHSDIDQAMGLSFSVPDGVHPPPSLINIFKELKTDIPDFNYNSNNGNLIKWAQQGVLLLNTALTVLCKTPGSHFDIWDKFINHILNEISQSQQGHIVFMLWGNPAKERLKDIKNKDNHLILQSVHPSPLSAMRGWFGCKQFSQSNEFLNNNGINPINWSLI